jgi:pimeloyl-ACP methyl ester carboxylesterase
METKEKRQMLYYETHLLSEDKPWLVFVHGAGGSIITWKYQVEAFRPYFNLLLLDLRDHGSSKNLEPEFSSYNFDLVARDILEVIDHIGIQKAHFMSLSLGSVILQKLDEIRPNLIDRMIMAGGIFKANFKIKLFVHSARFLNHFLSYRTMYDIFSIIVLPKKNHRTSRRIFRLQSRKLSPKEYLKWVDLHKDFFRILKDFFHRELKKVSLVVMGAEDHVFFKAAEKFVRTHAKAHLVCFEKCGHVCNIEQAERFNQISLNFLLEGH